MGQSLAASANGKLRFFRTDYLQWQSKDVGNSHLRDGFLNNGQLS